MNRLRIEGLDGGNGAVTVLREVSLEVREGELVALLGMNCNGKSTLLNCLIGYTRPKAGRILLDWTARPSTSPPAGATRIIRTRRNLVSKRS